MTYIHVVKSALAHHVPMIIGPASYLRVEFFNQIGGRHAKRGFDRSSNALQERLDVFLGRFDEQFPARVSAHVLSEEVEAVCHVHNDRLRRRKFQSSFLQKMLDEGFHFFFQQFFRSAGDDEVIRIPDEIDAGFLISYGLETRSCWVLFLQKSLKSIQRTVSERWGDNTALRSPFRRFVKDVFFH